MIILILQVNGDQEMDLLSAFNDAFYQMNPTDIFATQLIALPSAAS